MPLDAAQYQSLIITEVGDDAAGTLASNMATLWTKHDDAASLELHYLYAKRSAIDVMLGRVRVQTTITAADGSKVDLNMLFTHLSDMRADTDALIELALQAGITGAAGAGAIGQLTTTAPVLPPGGSRVDANDRAYRGDPYRVSRRRP